MAVPQHAKTNLPNLLGMTLPEMTSFFAELGEKPFRAKQVFRWIHHFGADNFDAMTDLAKSLREKLPSVATISPPVLMTSQESKDGTRKWLLDVGTGNGIEVVFIPEDDRGTLCVSSQVGCALDCTFVRLVNRDSIAISPPLKLLASFGGPIKPYLPTPVETRKMSASSAMS